MQQTAPPLQRSGVRYPLLVLFGISDFGYGALGPAASAVRPNSMCALDAVPTRARRAIREVSTHGSHKNLAKPWIAFCATGTSYSRRLRAAMVLRKGCKLPASLTLAGAWPAWANDYRGCLLVRAGILQEQNGKSRCPCVDRARARSRKVGPITKASFVRSIYSDRAFERARWRSNELPGNGGHWNSVRRIGGRSSGGSVSANGFPRGGPPGGGVGPPCCVGPPCREAPRCREGPPCRPCHVRSMLGAGSFRLVRRDFGKWWEPPALGMAMGADGGPGTST